MRVAFVVPYLQTPSGWRSASIGMVRAMEQYANVEPIVIVRKADEAAAAEFFPEYCRVIVPETQKMALDLPKSWPKLMETWLRIKKLHLSVELVHSLDAYPTGLVGHWLSRTNDIPHVVTAMGTYAVKWYASQPDRRAYSDVLRQASVICPISEGTRKLMFQYFAEPLLHESCKVTLLGTDYHLQVPRSAAIHRNPDKIPTLLSVGKLKPRKGYHVSLAAFAQVKRRFPECRYWIVGNTENKAYYTQLQKIIAENQLTGVEFLGNVSKEDLQRYYQRATLFLLTPQMEGLYFEGFGLVYLEAGAYGLPVVGTNVGGVSDAVQPGITGMLSNMGDVDQIASTILELLTDQTKAAEMGRANRNRSEKLSWKRYAKEQCSTYLDVLERSV
jgi:glycosyltransferase involved in cell wall biosynthesis